LAELLPPNPLAELRFGPAKLATISPLIFLVLVHSLIAADVHRSFLAAVPRRLPPSSCPSPCSRHCWVRGKLLLPPVLLDRSLVHRRAFSLSPAISQPWRRRGGPAPAGRPASPPLSLPQSRSAPWISNRAAESAPYPFGGSFVKETLFFSRFSPPSLAH
jgi:hypothetical protein